MDKLVDIYNKEGNTEMMKKAANVKDGLNLFSLPKQMYQNLQNTLKQAIAPPASLTRPSFQYEK